DLPWASCPVTTRRMGRLTVAPSLLDPHVFDGRRPRIRVDEHEGRLHHLRADPARPDEVVDGAEADALMEKTLDLVQHGLSLLPVRLPRLLLEERVDVRIAAIGEGAIARHGLRHAGRGIAVHGVDADAEALELLRGERRVEGCTLHVPDPGL